MSRDILDKYGNLTLAIDNIAINKNPFIITTSRNMHFAQQIWCMTRQQKQCRTKQVVQAYIVRGSRVMNILGDRGLECMRRHLVDMGITLNVTCQDKHVLEVEQYIRTTKEMERGHHQHITFDKIA